MNKMLLSMGALLALAVLPIHSSQAVGLEDEKMADCFYDVNKTDTACQPRKATARQSVAVVMPEPNYSSSDLRESIDCFYDADKARKECSTTTGATEDKSNVSEAQLVARKSIN